MCRFARSDQDAQAAVKQGHEPADCRHHDRYSDSLDLVRLLDFIATGDRMEHDSRRDQFSDRWGILSVRVQRKK